MGFSTHSFCDLQYDCGCLPPYFGATEHCSIHAPTEPDCPWCTGGNARQVWIWSIILGSVGGALWLGRRHTGFGRTMFIGLLGYFVGGSIAGLIGAIVTNYPTWYGFSL